jgi:hypothetical protein
MREGRKTWAALLLVALGALALCACQPYQPSAPGPITITNNNSNQNQNGSTPGSSGPSDKTCNPVGSVDISVPAASLKVGESITLDATPKDPAGQARTDACNIADGVAWGVAGPCSLDSTSSFNPVLKGTAAGTCAVSATVHGVTSEVRTLLVVP